MSASVSQRWVLAGGFAVAALYAVVAVVELLAGDEPAVAIPWALMAVMIAGPLAVVARLFAEPRGGGAGGDDPGSDGHGPRDGGDLDPSATDWWPQFEREFWGHVASQRVGSHVGDGVGPPPS
jgi:hypothetical protein